MYIRNQIFNPVKIAYSLFESRTGSSDKPPLIFLHGLLDRKETWNKIPPFLAEMTKRKVYTYDARNHGQSGNTMDSHFDNNLSDLYKFMHDMKIHRTILIGHNMGGLTAIRAALQQPSMIETAFIVDMHVNPLPRKQIKDLISFMQIKGLLLHYVLDITRRPNLAWVPPVAPPVDKIKDEALLRSVLLYRYLALADALIEYDRFPVVPLIGEYLEPIYFIYGVDIPYTVDEHIPDIIKFFPKAQLIRFQGIYNNFVLDRRTFLINTLLENIPADDTVYL